MSESILLTTPSSPPVEQRRGIYQQLVSSAQTAHYSHVTTSFRSPWGLFYEFQNHQDLFRPASGAKRDSFFSALKRIYSALGHQRQRINQRLLRGKVSQFSSTYSIDASRRRRDGLLLCMLSPQIIFYSVSPANKLQITHS